MHRSRPIATSLLAVVAALAVGLVAVIGLLGDVGEGMAAYAAMLTGGLGDPLGWNFLRPWGETGVKAAVLGLAGLSVAVAFRAGMFNIGAQGQLLFGALAAALVGAHLALPAPLHLVLCLAAAAVAGGLWALPAAALKLHRGVHEVISTIMLNWVATSLIEGWWVVGPLRAPAAPGQSVSGTEEIHATAHLPRLLGEASRLHAGVLLALVASVGLTLWLFRSRPGFETRAIGLGPEVARASGINVPRRTYVAMALSGALAGLAGASLVLGTEHRYPTTIGAPYGFDGIAMAVLGRAHPLGVFASALGFGALRAGGTSVQLFGVHKSFPELIQGLAMLFVAAPSVWDHLLRRRRP